MLVVCIGKRVEEECRMAMRRLERYPGLRFVMSDWLHDGDMAEACAIWITDDADVPLSLLASFPRNLAVLCPAGHAQADAIAARQTVLRYASAAEAESVVEQVLTPERAVAAAAGRR